MHVSDSLDSVDLNWRCGAVETPCAKPSSAAEEKPVASPAKEVSVETKVVVVKTEHEASASSAAKEVPVARPPITVEEEKYVLEKTLLEAIGNVLQAHSLTQE
ncbi:hypothetical protein Bca52824_006889 [Brassica carinata]|uniref:Uncharacterized protein n=1 Tax=Brassica carinata TaxID=52824 RepID=A0A8X7W6U4_BRACI|nr:hypothetical protein Bca52824_006889 [Brassica carinata]